MRCTFCERKAVHELEFRDAPVMHLCESCGRAFREGFEKGRVYESADRKAELLDSSCMIEDIPPDE